MPTTTGKIYLGSVQISGGSSWTRPADWLPRPTVAAGEKVMRAIYGVTDDATNYVALLATVSAGNYVVDWGDGTVDVVASNVQAEHLYDFNAVGMPAANAEEQKQVIVTVTAQTANLTSINLQRRYNLAALNQWYAVNWLDIAIGGSTITSLTIGGNTVLLGFVRRVFVGEHAMTSLASLCSLMGRLVDFQITGSVSAVTRMDSMFVGCLCLQTIAPFTGSVASVTRMDSMFNGCYSLQTIPPFPGSVAAVTQMQFMFINCSALQTIPPFPGSVASVQFINNIFNNCFSLTEIPPFPVSVAGLRNMNAMFENCYSLLTIPPFPSSTELVTTMNYLFKSCRSLRSIPAFETSGITSCTGTFLETQSLAKGRTNGLRFAVTYPGDKLTAAEIDEIFTGLGTASGTQIVTVSGHIGSATCTPSIATAKGWTVAV